MDVPPDQLIEQARERFASQDYYGCIHLLRDVTESGHAYADVHNLLGLAFHLVGQTSQALESLDRALALNPRYHEAHIHRGIILAELGRPDDAQHAFASAAASQGKERHGIPGHMAAKLANLHAGLGDAYAEAEAVNDAIEQYRRAIRLGPTFHDLRYRLARLLLEAGRALEAKEELATLLTAHPDAVEAKASLGLACYMAGEVDDARATWNELLTADPHDARAKAYLAMLKRADGAE